MYSHYSDNPTRTNRAVQIYIILMGYATRAETLTYKDLAGHIGYDGAGVFAQTLDMIQNWCQHHQLPLLTAIVVNSATGEPGDGLLAEDFSEEQNKVFVYNWYGITVPTAQNFEDFWRIEQQRRANNVVEPEVA